MITVPAALKDRVGACRGDLLSIQNGCNILHLFHCNKKKVETRRTYTMKGQPTWECLCATLRRVFLQVE